MASYVLSTGTLGPRAFPPLFNLNADGGTDTLAYVINKQLAAHPCATVLVSQPAGQEGVEVNGVVCAEERGSVSFLFGLRVAEDARGNGLATQLLTHICQASAAPSHIRHLFTTTIPQNQPPQRVLGRLGFTHTHTVDRWPQEPLQFEYEAAVGFQPNRAAPEQPVVFSPSQLNMLDYLPGARQVVSQLVTAMGVQRSDWVCCSDVQQLQEAVASVRQQQQQQQEDAHKLLPPQLQQAVFEAPSGWLPWVYEVFPLQSAWVQERIAAGEVWLLPQGAAEGQGQPTYGACVVLSHSSNNFRMCAGVTTAQDGYIAAAFDFVSSLVPHFVAYVDTGRRHSSGAPDRDLILPATLSTGSRHHDPEQYMCYVVLSRPAEDVLQGENGGMLTGPSKL